MEEQQNDQPPGADQDRLAALEKRVSELEKGFNSRGRAMSLSVVAIYAVFAALLILHWAGHFMRHS